MAGVASAIIHGCIYNDEYMRGVIPHIKLEYFETDEEKVIYRALSKHIEKYNKRPSKDALIIAIHKNDDISDDIYKDCSNYLIDVEKEKNKEIDKEWLIDETEEWCKNRDLVLSIQKAVLIIRGEDKDSSINILPELLQKSLSISFDSTIGHDYMENAEDRYEFYHEDLERIPFDLAELNKITKGGTPNKTLNIILAATGGFKSGTMCHMAAANLTGGKDVLYITCEMSEERIGERIDANLLDCELDDLSDLTKDQYMSRVNKVKANTSGNLVIKEYAPVSAHAGHFRHLLKELELKKNFKPQIVYVDYLNICASSRCKGGTDSYTLVKSIAEELRGLAVEFDIPFWSATQTNRAGYGNSDVDLSNVSESAGLASTCDLMLAAMCPPELEEQGLMLYKQLKNRYGAIDSKNEKFVIGVNKSKMRLFDVDDQAASFQADFKNMPSTKLTATDVAAKPQFGVESKKSDNQEEFSGFDFS